MFQTSELKEYQLFDNQIYKGKIYFNPLIKNKGETTRPFIRNGLRKLISIGRVNYEFLDQFIIKSLNEIYTHINDTKDRDLVADKIRNYQELYSLWQRVILARQNNDLNVNNYYDDLLYRLYLLGYKN